MNEIQWREPLWLLLALQPLLLGLTAWWRSRHAHALQADWVEPALRPWVLPPQSGGSRRLWGWHRASTALAWLLLAVAAAGPRLPPTDQAIGAAANLDLVLVADLSRSMAATDIAPSRLRRVPIELQELLQRAPGARVAVLVYAGRPHVLVPPTNDHKALAYYLRLLPRIPLPTSGSRAAPALEQALETAQSMQAQRRAAHQANGQAAASRGGAAVVWLTDGDSTNLAKGSNPKPPLETIAARYREAGITLAILGLGTPTGSGIPLPGGGWVEQQGRAVVSSLDETALKHLAATAGGAYSPVRDDDGDWRILYDHTIAATIHGQPDHGDIQWRELYPWALAPALALLFTAGLLAPAPAVLLLPLLALLLSVAPAGPARAQWPGDRTPAAAYEAYHRGDYQAAADRYARFRGYAARMGEGSSYYRLEHFAAAAAQFRRAVLLAGSDGQRADALYNLGNSLFRQGLYARAGEAYRDAVGYNPTLEQGRFNLQLSLSLDAAVRKELERRGKRLAAAPLPGARIEAEVEPGESTYVSRGPSTMPAPKARLPGRLPGSSAAMDALIARGLAQVTTMGAEKTPATNRGNLRPSDRTSVQARQDRVEARLRMGELQDQGYELWKRLFEMEEGFPAPLAQPGPLPGTAPW